MPLGPRLLYGNVYLCVCDGQVYQEAERESPTSSNPDSLPPHHPVSLWLLLPALRCDKYNRWSSWLSCQGSQGLEQLIKPCPALSTA